MDLLLVRSKSFRAELRISFFPHSGTSDYGAISIEIPITGTERVIVSVPLINDTQLEREESFFGILLPDLGAANSTNIIFSPIFATANIIDNDGKK